MGGKNFLPLCELCIVKVKQIKYVQFFHDSRASGCVFNVLSGMPLLAIGCGGNILLAAALGLEKILKVLG